MKSIVDHETYLLSEIFTFPPYALFYLLLHMTAQAPEERLCHWVRLKVSVPYVELCQST